VQQHYTYEENAGVMVHVEEAQLLPPLLGNNEEGIHKVKHLGEVKDVQDEAKGGVLRFDGQAGQNGVPTLVCLDSSLQAHV
jgi:hypothetical protein